MSPVFSVVISKVVISICVVSTQQNNKNMSLSITLCWVSFMLSAVIKLIMLSVILPSVIILRVTAPAFEITLMLHQHACTSPHL